MLVKFLAIQKYRLEVKIPQVHTQFLKCMFGAELCPPKFPVLKSSPHKVTAFGDRSFKEVMTLK